MHDIINDALRSPCETLHGAVYAWLIEKGLHGELVALAAPSLESYLIHVNAPELLWQFYERNKNHAAAAKILYSLSTKAGYIHLIISINLLFKKFYNKTYYFVIRPETPLPKRVEYLARAVVCMRSDEAGYAPTLGVFLRELEDKVEVARIQQLVNFFSNVFSCNNFLY